MDHIAFGNLTVNTDTLQELKPLLISRSNPTGMELYGDVGDPVCSAYYTRPSCTLTIPWILALADGILQKSTNLISVLGGSRGIW